MVLGREKLSQFFRPYGEVGSRESSRLLPQVTHKGPYAVGWDLTLLWGGTVG